MLLMAKTTTAIVERLASAALMLPPCIRSSSRPFAQIDHPCGPMPTPPSVRRRTVAARCMSFPDERGLHAFLLRHLRIEIERSLGHLELDPLHLTGEFAQEVVRRDRRAAIAADVERLIARERQRLGAFDAPVAERPVVDVQPDGPTLG